MRACAVYEGSFLQQGVVIRRTHIRGDVGESRQCTYPTLAYRCGIDLTVRWAAGSRGFRAYVTNSWRLPLATVGTQLNMNVVHCYFGRRIS